MPPLPEDEIIDAGVFAAWGLNSLNYPHRRAPARESMSDQPSFSDPFEFFKRMWMPLGVPVPGFGPPLHTHDWAETFYILDGEFEFQTLVDGKLETIIGRPGATVYLPRGVPHAFKNSADRISRMLTTHAPAGLESFFEEYGVEVEKVGDVPAGLEPPDPAQMAEILARHGVQIVEVPIGAGA